MYKFQHVGHLTWFTCSTLRIALCKLLKFTVLIEFYDLAYIVLLFRHRIWTWPSEMVASIEGDDATDALPDLSSCKEFYAKYEIKEILGRYPRVGDQSVWAVICLDCFSSIWRLESWLNLSKEFFLLNLALIYCSHRLLNALWIICFNMFYKRLHIQLADRLVLLLTVLAAVLFLAPTRLV